MNASSLIVLAGSAGYLAGGLWALQRRAGRPDLARLAGVYCLLSLAWGGLYVVQQLGWLAGLRSDFQTRLPVYGLYVLAIFLWMLSRALVGRPAVDLRWALPALAWGVAALAIDAGWIPFPEMLYFTGGRVLSRAGLVLVMLAAGWAVCLGAAALLTVLTSRRTSRYYTLLSYWAVVLILTAVGDMLVCAGLLGASRFVPAFVAFSLPAGALVRLAATLLAVYVVTNLRLPAIEHSLRRLIGSLVFLVASIGVYAAALTGLQLVFRGWSTLPPLASSLIASSLLVLLFTGLIQRFYKWSRRAVAGGGRQNMPALLRRYSQSITGTLDLNRLATLIVGTAGDYLEVKRGYLFMVDQEHAANEHTHYTLRGVRGLGPRNPEDGILGENSPVALSFRETCRPITQMEIELQGQYKTLPASERAWLGNLGAEVYVPICAKGEWIGLLALGPKGAGTEYTPRDLAFLSTLADQTAVALENTRLVEGLMRLNNEFRRAYTALDQANQHLERLDKTKSDFISIASHELRTPLTLINGASQMLLDDPDLPDNPYHQQLLQKIKAGGQRLHEIVESMLDVAKIDMRTLELEPQPVSMLSLVQSVTSELKKTSTDRQQTINIEVPLDLPAVIADVVALRKVFAHLITNAIKYTPDGGQITISGKRLEPNLTDLPNGGVEIVVTDSGIGIDPRFQELIFVKFYQTGELALHSTGKTKFKGSGPGLGLAIARGIIEAHHGRIWVESPGYDEESCPGSQFHVVLPLRPSERPAAPAAFSL